MADPILLAGGRRGDGIGADIASGLEEPGHALGVVDVS